MQIPSIAKREGKKERRGLPITIARGPPTWLLERDSIFLGTKEGKKWHFRAVSREKRGEGTIRCYVKRFGISRELPAHLRRKREDKGEGKAMPSKRERGKGTSFRKQKGGIRKLDSA